MHQIIVEGLERHLAGAGPGDPGQREFTAHLAACEPCRLELQEMRELAGLFTVLRPVEGVEPPLGFYARVARNIDEQAGSSFWRMFSLDPLLRRVAFASLMTLAVLGSYLVMQESNYGYPYSPETVMAIESGAPAGSPAYDAPSSGEREMMLVTLTSYQP
jgi:hypothetical protein